MLRLMRIMTVLVLLMQFAPQIADAANVVTVQNPCVICISEFQVSGRSGSESEDYVIITNSTAVNVSLSSVQLQYLNSSGVFDSKISLSGTLLAGQSKAYVSSDLQIMNSGASLLTLPLYSGGGSLQVIKELTTTTTIYDRVGWGTTAVYEGATLPVDGDLTFARNLNISGAIVDTNHNNTDFSITESSCRNISFNEIQPFVTDGYGKTIPGWIEFRGGQNPTGPCSLVLGNGKKYLLGPETLPAAGELSIVEFGEDELGHIAPLQLVAGAGNVWVGSRSKFGAELSVTSPIISSNYSSLVKNQSWALVSEYQLPVWKSTFSITPNEENILLASTPIAPDGDAHACESVRITEIFPNATGSDTDNEWLEIQNISNTAVDLKQCVVTIAEVPYYFLSDSRIGAGEYKRFFDLWDESGASKTVALRNTDLTLVMLNRLYAGSETVLQSFEYQDAPEAQSYSRFDDGWRWTFAITPDSANVLELLKPAVLTTEKAAAVSTAAVIVTSGSTGAISSAQKTAIVKTAKVATAKKAASSSGSASNSSKSSPKAAVKSATTSNDRKSYQAPAAVNDQSINPLVLVGTGALAVIYAGYEYRNDISSKIYLWKRNRTARRSGR